jgi:hypothetical protein
MLIEEITQQAIVELTKLKEHATTLEWTVMSGLAKQDLLRPRATNGCIYGSMTGSCFSPRAYTLIKQCAAPPFYKDLDSGEMDTKLEYDWADVARARYTALEVALVHDTKQIIIEIAKLSE